MGFAVFFAKLGGFIKKNWKVIGIIIAFLIVSGMAKRFIGRILMWLSVRKASSDPTEVDYNFMAISVHSAMYKGLFNWGENEEAVTGFINSLANQSEFLALCSKYALKYGEDLRGELRDHFSDKQYAKLLYK